MKKRIALFLAGLLAISVLAGCGGGGSSSTAGSSGSTPSASGSASGSGSTAKPEALSDEVLTVAISAEPNQLVPNVVFCGNHISMINNLIYEPLIASDHGTLQPKDTALVTYEAIDDTHYRLTLREGVKFHNGEEFTTADVQYMFEEGAKGTHSGDRYFVFDAANFVIEDDYNIVIALTQPWAQAMEMLSFNEFMAISKTELSAIGGAGKTAQYIENAGTGKYIFKEWVPGEYIELVRNENYWNQDDLGYFAGYKFMFINDSTARGMAVQSGDVDLATDLDLANHSVYEADQSVKNVLMHTNNVSTIFLNSGNGGAFEDVRVREAVYWLVDKEALRNIGASGFGEIADTIIAPMGPMFDGATIEQKAVDVEKAKALLAEAGYADGLTVRMRGSSETAITAMIQEQLRAGGINVEMVLAENAVHFAALAEGDFDLYVSSQQFAYYTEPVRCCDGITNSYAQVMGGCGYKNEEFTEIALRCYSTGDLAARKEAYAELQQHFRENFVSVALYTGVGLHGSRPDLEGFELRGVGTLNLENLYSTGA